MLKPVMVAGMEPGGQLTTTTDVENYPGFAEVIQGPWLMEQMREQAKAVGNDLVEDHIQSVNLKSKPFEALEMVVKNILLIQLLFLQELKQDG